MTSFENSVFATQARLTEKQAWDFLAARMGLPSVASSGSSTWVQVADGAGGFSASAYFTFDAAAGVLNVTGPNANLISFDDSAGQLAVTVSDALLLGGVNGITLDSANPIVIGDATAAGTRTTLTISDANQRIVVKAPKPVIGDASGGGFYVYNATTSTYWNYAPDAITGQLIGTDTTSASLP